MHDGIYHVTSRGVERRDIFMDAEDRATFMSIARTVKSDHDWQLLTYCLMPNHFHLVVLTKQPNLSRGMQQLKSTYARRFNARHDRWGTLFGQRFDDRLVQRDDHLLAVLRYVALNPVRDGFCADPLAWRWSGHAVLLGAVEDTGLVDVAATMALLDRDPAVAARRYSDLVSMQDGEQPEEVGAVAGDASFRRAHLPDVRPHRDLPVREWGDGRPPLDSLLAGGRGADLARAVRLHGYTFVEVAERLDVHPMTVSRRLKRFEQEQRERA